MNIVLITTGKRTDLSTQSLRSLRDNAANWSSHTLTVVIDNPDNIEVLEARESQGATVIVNPRSEGASASRNIGASSIPKYRRQEHVCFFDDDVYAVKGWDERIEETLRFLPTKHIVSSCAHPYNHPLGKYFNSGAYNLDAAGVLSSVNMAMPWEAFDEIGWWTEPGGAAGSEDYDFSMRALAKGYHLLVLEPQTVLHCGVTSSNGNPIVGADLVMQRNEELMKLYGIEGRVRFA